MCVLVHVSVGIVHACVCVCVWFVFLLQHFLVLVVYFESVSILIIATMSVEL